MRPRTGLTLFVFHPAGNGGAAMKVWERLQSTVPDLIASADVRFTERGGHAREIATAAQLYEAFRRLRPPATAHDRAMEQRESERAYLDRARRQL